MADVFVSHASIDQALVDEFVDLVLRNGCGLTPGEIFYSSGADTGVPDGRDLLAHVRDQVSETGLVIAMLTPTFQTRPVCVAELGAAWGRTGRLFPLLAPGMDRKQLEGVLTTALVEYMDDEGALDRLHQRIVDATDKRVEAATWTPQVEAGRSDTRISSATTRSGSRTARNGRDLGTPLTRGTRSLMAWGGLPPINAATLSCQTS